MATNLLKNKATIGEIKSKMTTKDTCIMIDDLILPINPEEIEESNPTASTKYIVLGLGQIEVLQGRELRECEISGIFPKFEAHYVNKGFLEPSEYIERLRKMQNDCEVVHFVYTGDTEDLNYYSSIHDLKVTEKGGDVGSWYYSFTVREWRDYSAQQIQKPTTLGGEKRTRKQNPDPAQSQGGNYTVIKGDNLHKIAKKTLGDASRWREIYELNKDSIKNPNLIYPDQELQLPTNRNGTIKETNAKNTSDYNGAKQLIDFYAIPEEKDARQTYSI